MKISKRTGVGLEIERRLAQAKKICHGADLDNDPQLAVMLAILVLLIEGRGA